MCIIKHCDKLGLEATRQILNKTPIIPIILSVSSVSEMNKFYQMCQKGLQCYYLKVEADTDECNQMIEITINSLKLGQAKVIFLFYKTCLTVNLLYYKLNFMHIHIHIF